MVHRPQPFLDAGGERLEGHVASGMAQAVVEALEVVDVDEADGQRLAAALGAGALGFEGDGHAAPVGHLGQHIGGDLLGQAAQLAFELAHTALQFAGAAVFLHQALAGAGHHLVHCAGFIDHLTHHTGQAFERVCALDDIGVAHHAVVEAAGGAAQLAQLAEHGLDHGLHGIAGLIALDEQLLLLAACVLQQLARRVHGASPAGVVQTRRQGLALALCPTAVFSQIGQTCGERSAQQHQLIHQMMSMCKQAFDAGAHASHLSRHTFVSAIDRDAISQRRQLIGQLGGPWLLVSQTRLQGPAERGMNLRMMGFHDGCHDRRLDLCRGRRLGDGANRQRCRRRAWWRLRIRVSLTRRRFVPALIPCGDQLPQPLLQTQRIASAAIEHALQAVLFACSRPLFAAPLQATGQFPNQASPTLGQCSGFLGAVVR